MQVELERVPPMDQMAPASCCSEVFRACAPLTRTLQAQQALEEAQRLLKAILGLCTAWPGGGGGARVAWGSGGRL